MRRLDSSTRVWARATLRECMRAGDWQAMPRLAADDVNFSEYAVLRTPGKWLRKRRVTPDAILDWLRARPVEVKVQRQPPGNDQGPIRCMSKGRPLAIISSLLRASSHCLLLLHQARCAHNCGRWSSERYHSSAVSCLLSFGERLGIRVSFLGNR